MVASLQIIGKSQESLVTSGIAGLPTDTPLSLDLQGFKLLAHESKVEDLWNPHEVQRLYYREVEALLKAATGADKLLAFDHNVRSFRRAKKGLDGAAIPVEFAHTD